MRPNNPLRLVLVCLIALFLTVAAPASLTGSAAADNSQDGDNTSDTDQGGESSSGDAIAGQVFGSVSGGDVSGDATNRSQDVDVESGDSEGSNDADNFVGQLSVGGGGGLSPANDQTGDNDLAFTQRADVSSGDAVGGQVIGVVTSAGGTADLVAANTSEDVDAETGDAEASNDADVFVGLLAVTTGTGDIVLSQTNEVQAGDFAVDNTIVQSNELNFLAFGAGNTQEGDNEADLAQGADAASGDAVGGQVLGLVSSGSSSLDATNRSSDVDVTTGDAESTNDFNVFAGLLAVGDAGDVTIDQSNGAFGTGTGNTIIQSNTANIGIGSLNSQTGDNAVDQAQNTSATSGDGVGGQVIGVVTSAGGAADVVGSNTSEEVELDTGDATSSNESDAFAGLLAVSDAELDLTIEQLNEIDLVGDDNTATQTNTLTLLALAASNEQDGDNSVDGAQEAISASGDAVGGQVLGIVAAGAASVDATNLSSEVDIETGDSESANDSDVFAGLLAESEEGIGTVMVLQANVYSTAGQGDFGETIEQINIDEFLFGDPATNSEAGDIEHEVVQSATSSSGDGVGGQVIGVVTSVGGTADVVVANESADIDLESGDSEQSNDEDSFVGLQIESVVLENV